MALMRGLIAGRVIVATSFGINYQFASRSNADVADRRRLPHGAVRFVGLVLGLWLIELRTQHLTGANILSVERTVSYALEEVLMPNEFNRPACLPRAGVHQGHSILSLRY